MSTWLERYLTFLEVERRAPSLAALSELTRAHMARVPFESISSILRRTAAGAGPVPPLDTDEILDGWIARRAGGVCFEVATMVDRLLQALGYSTFVVLARISVPGAHQANLVALDGDQYLVDVGNGAPFAEPIPLARSVEIWRAGLAYRFRPGPDPGVTWQDRFVDDQWQPFAEYTLTPADPQTRHTAYARHHTPGRSWVVDNLVLVRSTHDSVWSLRDAELRQFTRDGKTSRRLTHASDYRHAVADIFDIPALPIEAARAALAARLSAEAPSGQA